MGEVALITGGAGGLGRAFAHALLRRGFAGVGVLDVQGHEAFAEELRRQYGPASAAAFRCDVTNPASVRAAYDAVRGHFGRLDVVVNNAGIALQMFEDVERHVGVNLLGVVYGTREACRLMNPEGDYGGRGGAIVNIASIAGIVPVQFSPVYAATKAAVVNLSRSLGWLAEAYGIRVNAICPNFVDTPMVQRPEMEPIVAMQPGGLLAPSAVADALLRVVADADMAGQAVVVTAAKGMRVHDFGGRAGAAAVPAEVLKAVAKL